MFAFLPVLDTMLPCRFRQAFGLACPGCGLQRSFYALLKGDILSSFLYYPALLPFLGLLVSALVYVICPTRSKRIVLLVFAVLTVFLVVVHWIVLLVRDLC